MRKAFLAAAVLILLVLAGPVFSDEIELGLSWTPVPGTDPTDPTEEFNSITGFHVAYSFFEIVYASWDSLVMPPPIIEEWTGYRRPGFLNLIDIGIRLELGPIMLTIEGGVNNIYVWRQGEIQGGLDPTIGANLRLAAAFRMGWWSVGLSGTAVFPSFQYMVNTLSGLVSPKTQAASLDKIVNALVPTIMVVIYI